MKNQKYIINNCNTFELKDIFECGQCFRWNKKEDDSYIGVVYNNVIKVSKKDNIITFESFGEDNLEELLRYYFDI